jgi:glutathione synthase/RimK-type ligase-like ATP-grasp enzyme
VLIRSPWDYQQSCDEFLNVLSQIDASNARLENSLDIVRWNVRKTYLQQLEQSGVTIVPTHWVSSPSVAELRNLFTDLNSSAVVIKPVVGAGAENAFWLRPESPESLFQQVQQVYAGKIGLAQPFVESVTTFGELSLIFFGDDFSHCVQKQPKSGDFRVQEEHGGLIQSYEPSPALLRFAQQALQKIPGKTVYARVDIVMLNDASPAIMEVELIEPSLYLSYDLKSPERFANVIEALL